MIWVRKISVILHGVSLGDFIAGQASDRESTGGGSDQFSFGSIYQII